MSYDPEQDMHDMNVLLDQAGKLADRVTGRGYDVEMWLWTRPGSTMKGRLQWNVAKARAVKRDPA